MVSNNGNLGKDWYQQKGFYGFFSKSLFDILDSLDEVLGIGA